MFRRIAICLVLALLALPAPAWADLKQDERRCTRDPNPDIRIGICTRLIQSGRYNNTNLAIIFNSRGVSYTKKRQYDRAIRDYGEAIRLKPNYAHAFLNRGNAYYFKRQFDRAIRNYTDAIRRKPNLASAYGGRGLAYELLRQRGKAIADYRKAIMLRPGDRVGTSGLKRLGVTP